MVRDSLQRVKKMKAPREVGSKVEKLALKENVLSTEGGKKGIKH
jgi:hypothetical protein